MRHFADDGPNAPRPATNRTRFEAFDRIARRGYIADFLAPSVLLIVEVDGTSHRGRATSDARRDRVLARLGYRILRLEAGLVLQQPALAIARIQAALARS